MYLTAHRSILISMKKKFLVTTSINHLGVAKANELEDKVTEEIYPDSETTILMSLKLRVKS